MFIRNGEVLGSVLHSAVPGTQPEPQQQPEPEPTPEPAEPIAEKPAGVPPHYAAKHEWVDYAVQRGADREAAEEATKAELIEQYGAN